MLNLQNVTKVFRTAEVETTALDCINLRIPDGDFVSIMGPSGCGKSTLLSLIGLIDSPTSGDYWFRDENVSHLPERKLALLRKRHIGFIFQSFNLIDELSVLANVELPLLYQRIAPQERRRRATAVLEKVNMAHRSDHLPRQLSGGQQQRVAVARALVSVPPLILADEPAGNLDSANGEGIMDLLVQLNAEGTTVVMVTHSREHAAYGQRIIRMLDGRMLSENVVTGQTELERA